MKQSIEQALSKAHGVVSTCYRKAAAFDVKLTRSFFVQGYIPFCYICQERIGEEINNFEPEEKEIPNEHDLQMMAHAIGVKHMQEVHSVCFPVGITPGEWKIEQWPNGDQVVYVGSRQNDSRIAFIHKRNGEGKRNALAVSMIPGMLELAIMVVENANNHYDPDVVLAAANIIECLDDYDKEDA